MKPFYQEAMATIYCGNALDVLKSLPSESVQMAMTSPPYYGLRNYAGGTDIVLDPLGGSGTVGVVAKKLGRTAIIIDCVESYCQIVKRRIQKVVYQPKLI